MLATLAFAAPLILAATGALSWHGFALREWWLDAHSSEIVWRGDDRTRLVALTFDDGPDPAYTPRVLDILRYYGVKATFFEEGRLIVMHPELTRLAIAQGHEVGNHTFGHPYLNRENERQVRSEIARCDICLYDAAHYRTHLFRAPRGQWNPIIYREAQRDDERMIDWTVALEHQEARTPQAMAARVLRLVRPGGIILMHDGAYMSRESTVRALPLLLDGLRARGYRCVTVSELLRRTH